MTVRAAASALALALAAAPVAFAWGSTGHEFVTGAAIAGLSKDVPAFLKTPTTLWQITILGREPDRWKTAGKTHDYERDPAHYINVADDGTIAAGAWTLDNLPLGRDNYEAAARAKGVKPPEPGYLPYAMIDGWQQVAKDFAYYRASTVGAKTAKTAADRKFFADELKLREQLIIRDIGVWSHYVGDASQPLHTTEHHDGWDKYKDPMTYPPQGLGAEIRGVHSFYDGPFVKQNVTLADVKAAMTPYKDCGCTIEKRVPEMIKATLAQMPALYEFMASGALRDAKPAAKKFTIERLAYGASQTRDMIEDAWKASATMVVGYPNIPVADIMSGKVILSKDNYGGD